MTVKTFLSTSLLTTLALAASHDINVGNDRGAVAFFPPTTNAAPGDTLVFHFFPGHDVIQGSFDKPCQYASGGFYSGIPSGSSEPFVVTVNSTDPIFFYCSVSGHCRSGMVGVVNPSSDQTLEKYSSGARSASSVESPKGVASGTGGTFGTGSSSGGSSSASGSASASSSGSRSSATGGSATATSGSTGSSSSAPASTSAAAGGGASGIKEVGVGAMGMMMALSGLMALF